MAEFDIVDLSSSDVDKDARIADLEAGIRMVIPILHKTNVRKKDVADHLRALIGLRPGERVPKS